MVILGTALLALGTAGAAASAAFLESCEVPGVGAARCGTFEVWENRVSRQGRRIGLKVIVLPARSELARPDPIFFFHGGPGGAATDTAAGLARAFAPLRADRDILLVDQRGTGGSYPLDCDLYGPPEKLDGYMGDFFPIAAVKACRPELEKKADLTRYTTDVFADDVEELRQALGYGPLNLFGASYGTRAALTFLRRHPESVRAVVLAGVSPPDDYIPLAFPRDAQRALDALVAECVADSACRNAFPKLKLEVGLVLGRLARQPAFVDVLNPATGQPARVPLSRDLAAETLRYMLYSPPGAGLLPAVVHAAAEGDYGPLADQALFGRQQIVDSGSHGMYLSITCAEDLPWIDPRSAATLAKGSFLGDYRFRQQSAACAEWRRAEVPRGFNSPVRADTPALILSGALDPVTPADYGDEVAGHLPRSRHVVIPYGAHQWDGLIGAECVDRLIVDFLRTASAQHLDVSCVAQVRRPPFALSLPPSQPIALAESELVRLAGSYAVEEPPLEIQVALEHGRLQASFQGRRFPLAPVSATRFRVAGGPLGLALVFDLADGRATSLTIEEGSAPPLRLARQP